MPSQIRTESTSKRKVPEGLWDKCPQCSAVLYGAELERNLQVCPKCDHHLRISARNRGSYFLDEEGQIEIGDELEPKDFLRFKDSKKYKDRLSSAQKSTGEKDALVPGLVARRLGHLRGALHPDGVAQFGHLPRRRRPRRFR